MPVQSKINKLADGIMEASWLAAIVSAPLFFNKYSSRIFEPDKATLIRSLALIILAAWIIKLANQGSRNKKVGLIEIIKNPIILPSIILAFVYILSTIFSVAPRISFWGSYVRLQGFYTTISYLIIFGAIASNLRRREQIERIITTAILTSLPISLYGVLQHAGRDPIPWGGDVTQRVASTMGNSIFVAAYLIMVFPLTLGRIVDSFSAILKDEKNLPSHVARSTVYIFIASLQLIAIYYTGSRGPWLGLFTGSFFLFVLLSLYWRKRWMTFSIIGLAVILGAGLITLNIPNGPLQSLRETDSLKRLGQLIDLESRTAKVRVLIWSGAADMVSPHSPLEYPDGHKDIFNAIRPLIGYGPETMHMAYNPFYPPDLAHVEKRNASPDRSHNETWDSLVITGALGLFAYLLVFGSIFYFGLKWLGLIESKTQRNLFLTLFIGGGLLGAIIFITWQGLAFLGVGIPFGMIIGLIVYFAISALRSSKWETENPNDEARNITLIVLLSAVVAHFVEINFGIAIVSTRTYFWVYAALLLLVGTLLPAIGEYSTKRSSATSLQTELKRKSRKRNRDRLKTPGINKNINPTINGLVTGLLLLPLSYEFISNLTGETNSLNILWNSFTHMQKNTLSFGVFALLVTTWLSANIVFTSESKTYMDSKTWWKGFGISSLTSLGFGLFYGLWLSGTLAKLARIAPSTITEVFSQSKSFEGLLTQYYIFLFILLIGVAIALFLRTPSGKSGLNKITTFLIPILIFLTLWLITTTNLRIIHADISFKMAEPFANSNQWPVAIQLYQRAKSLAPDEDYYYLFLGRAYLEEAKATDDPAKKEQIFLQAESDLKRAQKINPLNPDHTANLARLYSWWALQASDKSTKQERGYISSEYYKEVIKLSPNNARLWNEWAILYLNILDQPEKAYELLNKSLQIDDQYDWTHAIMGDYYSFTANKSNSDSEKTAMLQKAATEYSLAIDTANKRTLESKQGLNYFFVLAGVYQRLGDIDNTITTLEESLNYANRKNDAWKVEENLAQLYWNKKDIDKAIINLQEALMNAPEDQQQRLQELLAQLQREK